MARGATPVINLTISLRSRQQRRQLVDVPGLQSEPVGTPEALAQRDRDERLADLDARSRQSKWAQQWTQHVRQGVQAHAVPNSAFGHDGAGPKNEPALGRQRRKKTERAL